MQSMILLYKGHMHPCVDTLREMFEQMSTKVLIMDTFYNQFNLYDEY